jgi:cysteine desulfuration protein SufE
MKTIQEIENQIIEEFSLFEDWMDRYNYIIELGKTLPAIDSDYKQNKYLISGCQSNVWLQAQYREGKVYFKAESDAIITKGIISLLVRVLSEHTPEEILQADLGFIDVIGLRQHLSPTRSNGLVSMLKQMKAYALGYQTMENTNRL